MRNEVHKSSGNVFADLKLADADLHMRKAQIVAEISRLARARKLSSARAGKRIGISQADVSRLFRGHFREYSIDRLVTFLTVLDQNVTPQSRS